MLYKQLKSARRILMVIDLAVTVAFDYLASKAKALRRSQLRWELRNVKQCLKDLPADTKRLEKSLMQSFIRDRQRLHEESARRELEAKHRISDIEYALGISSVQAELPVLTDATSQTLGEGL